MARDAPGDRHGDDTEVYCEKCGAVAYLPFEESFENRTLRCSGCGAPIYWFSCPTCETGYASAHPNAPCPSCPKGPVPVPTEDAPAGFFRKKCLWCGSAIGMFRLFTRATFIECPSCGRYLKVIGTGRALLASFAFIVIFAICLIPVRDWILSRPPWVSIVVVFAGLAGNWFTFHWAERLEKAGTE